MNENLIMLIVWLAVFIVALLVEIYTSALVSVWFCIGALVSLALTFIPGMPYWGEIIVFFVFSLISFLLIRPMVHRSLFRIRSSTNVDEMIHKKGVVIKDITGLEKGEVRVDNVIWTAIKRDQDDPIHQGDVVEVVSIVGNKLLVEKTKKGE